jgi:hypothetical protein
MYVSFGDKQIVEDNIQVAYLGYVEKAAKK